MKILIAGSGAMGVTYGSMLKKNGHDVNFLDFWQENIDKINKEGIKFLNLNKEEKIVARAYTPIEYKEQADLIIVFTKSMQLKNMLSEISHLIGEKTNILCLLNGLGHIDTIKEFVSEDKILMGVTTMTASMKGAGVFSVTNYGKTEIQNIGNNEEIAKTVVDAINNTGLTCEYSNNIQYSIWRKACINGTMNAGCTILKCNVRGLGKIPDVKILFENIVSEFVNIAKKEGVILNEKEMLETTLWHTTEEFKGIDHYPSMYQDLVLNRRKTEIDYLNGYISKKGKEYGIETKYCDLITLLIHAEESLLEI